MVRGTATPPRESTARESPQLATTIRLVPTTATTAVDPTVLSASPCAAASTSPSTLEKLAIITSLHRPSARGHPPVAATSSASTTCSRSRHACATLAPPCPSYTPKKSNTATPPPPANPGATATASSITLRRPISDTAPWDRQGSRAPWPSRPRISPPAARIPTIPSSVSRSDGEEEFEPLTGSVVRLTARPPALARRISRRRRLVIVGFLTRSLWVPSASQKPPSPSSLEGGASSPAMVVLGIADSNSFNRSRRGKGERERGGSQEASLLKVFVRRQRREVEGGEVEEALPSDPSLGADARDLRESVREDHRDVDHPRRRRGGRRWGLISHVARLVQGIRILN
ncbi:hypothetical protein BHE74_00023897 [Ensete ventricosum]|nr:hypothetical protein BHE74_00023897 [Ensete ventricosum]